MLAKPLCKRKTYLQIMIDCQKRKMEENKTKNDAKTFSIFFCFVMAISDARVHVSFQQSRLTNISHDFKDVKLIYTFFNLLEASGVCTVCTQSFYHVPLLKTVVRWSFCLITTFVANWSFFSMICNSHSLHGLKKWFSNFVV